MATKVKFAMDWQQGTKSKDRKLIGKIFTLKNETEDGSDLRGKFVDIDPEGAYVFMMTQKTSELEEISCKRPNTMMEIYK